MQLAQVRLTADHLCCLMDPVQVCKGVLRMPALVLLGSHAGCTDVSAKLVACGLACPGAFGNGAICDGKHVSMEGFVVFVRF